MAAPMLPDFLSVNVPASTASKMVVHHWLRQLLCQFCMALACILLWGVPGLVLAQTGVLPVPALTARVIDQTGSLSATDKAALEAKLAAYEQNKGSQIVVLMVPTTQPEDIAAYAHRVASDWKIGRRDVGDGVLLIVAKDDRRMRIEVARALEGALPDLAVARILDHTLQPQFRQNQYAAGIDAALDQIMRAIDGEKLAPVGADTTGRGKSQEVDWGLILVIVVMTSLAGGGLLKSFLGRILGSIITSALTGGLVFGLTGFALMAAMAAIASFFIALFVGLGDSGGNGGGGSSSRRSRGRYSSPIVIGGNWGGGDSWGGGGGGGFSSGGGGSFGGGGASEDW